MPRQHGLGNHLVEAFGELRRRRHNDDVGGRVHFRQSGAPAMAVDAKPGRDPRTGGFPPQLVQCRPGATKVKLDIGPTGGGKSAGQLQHQKHSLVRLDATDVKNAKWTTRLGRRRNARERFPAIDRQKVDNRGVAAARNLVDLPGDRPRYRKNGPGPPAEELAGQGQDEPLHSTGPPVFRPKRIKHVWDDLDADDRQQEQSEQVTHAVEDDNDVGPKPQRVPCEPHRPPELLDVIAPSGGRQPRPMNNLKPAVVNRLPARMRRDDQPEMVTLLTQLVKLTRIGGNDFRRVLNMVLPMAIGRDHVAGSGGEHDPERAGGTVG